MTVQEFYASIGGDYADVVRRLGNEARVKKVLGMLARDESMASLGAALARGDYEGAFQYAHTLKGVFLNLGLSRLAQADSALTETLRPGGECAAARPQFERVLQCYAQAVGAIAELHIENAPVKGGGAGVPTE